MIINKRIVREAGFTTTRGRKTMVALCPGDIIEFWDKGTRTCYEITFGAARDAAVKIKAEEVRRAKAAAKKAQRELRRG